ncbi:MAG: DUF6089 family protein [Saprospiraceae bacterium]|nr:DUF6089 family protein [Saprospiraceae bacterium]
MKPRLRIAGTLLMWISSCLGLICLGQGEVGLIAGFSNYQGDLTSYNIQDGIKVLVGPVFGVHGGYELNQTFQARADLLYTRLAGDDALAENTATRVRNLDFFAPVIQLAVGMDWNILGFSPKSGKAFTPFASVGASFFYFNPKTRYEGEKVSLQPLGTEGQFLEDYPDQKPYSRFQPSFQFGGGLKYLASENLILALEGMLSYTFTDYLDDASTIYITYPELLEKAGPLTAALANREGESLGTGPVTQPTGTARANPNSRDLFGVITLRVSMPVVIFSNQFNIRRHNNRTIPNPKF